MLTALFDGQGHAVGRRRHAAGVGIVKPGGQRVGLALQVERATTGHALAQFFGVETFDLMLGRHRQHQPFVLARMQHSGTGEYRRHRTPRQHTHREITDHLIFSSQVRRRLFS
jgi:hypothetical protein